MGFPDAPEAVALALLDRILDRDEAQARSNHSAERRLLDLYSQCLAAVRGDRAAAGAALLQ